MAAPRAKTLIERFGFNDPELTTPAHDEMFIVCMGSVQRIIDLVIESDDRFVWWRRMKQCLASHTLVYSPTKCNLPEPVALDILETLSYIPIKTIPEKPIVARNDFIIGFIDMFTHVAFNRDMSTGECEMFERTDKLQQLPSGQYERAFNRYDLHGVYDGNLDGIQNLLSEFNILIEIKPSIRSAGELIRQIQTYRQFAKGDTVYVVISKTTAFKDILTQSDILLINYEDVLPNQQGTL